MDTPIKSLSEANSEEKDSNKLNSVLSVLKLKPTTNSVSPGLGLNAKSQNCNIKLDKELKVSLIAIKTPKSKLNYNKLPHSDNYRQISLNKSRPMLTRKNCEKSSVKKNLKCTESSVGCKPPNPSESIENHENEDTGNSESAKQSEVPVLDNCKDTSMIADTNLPSKVGLFEISISNSINSSDNCSISSRSTSDEQLSQVEVTKTSKLILFPNKGKLQRVAKKTVKTEVPPRPLSPKIIIKNLSNQVADSQSPGVNKRKQRTPVKANLGIVDPTDNWDNNIEKQICNHELSFSNENKEKPISDLKQPLLISNTGISENGNQALSNNDSTLPEIFVKATASEKKNLIIPSKIQNKKLQPQPNSLITVEHSNLSGNRNSSAIGILNTNKPSSNDQELSVSNIKTMSSINKTSKRKHEHSPKSNDVLSSPPKRQKRNRVKFLHDTNDELETNNKEASLNMSVDNTEILNKTMLQLLQSRNVQVTFQKPKSVSPAKVSLGKMKPLKTEIKKFSPRKIKNIVKEKAPDNENQISNDNESEKISNSARRISTQCLNQSSTSVSSLSSSEEDFHSPGNLGKKQVRKIATMRTGEVTSGKAIKSILKKSKTTMQRLSPKKIINIDKKVGLDNESHISCDNENHISCDNENEKVLTSDQTLVSTDDSAISNLGLSLSENDLHSPGNLAKTKVFKIARMKTGKVASKKVVKGILKKPKVEILTKLPSKKLNKSSHQLNDEIKKMENKRKRSVSTERAKQIFESAKLRESESANQDNEIIQDSKVLNSSPTKRKYNSKKKVAIEGIETTSILKKAKVQKESKKKTIVQTPISKKKANLSSVKKLPNKKKSDSQESDLDVSIDNAGNLNEDLSESDDNMPIIYFQSASHAIKNGTSKDKTLQKKSNEDLKPIDSFVEHLKKESKRRRGRGRKRQKIGKKNGKVKDELETESSFFEDDGDEDEDGLKKASSLPTAVRRTNQKRTGRRYSVTGNWYIASGYLNDILSLLEDFENCDGWRFKDFSRCWQKKSFSLVYRGRQTFKELLEFSEEIALLTMRFIGPSHATKRRIGALYTLYGLYYKFPVGHFFSLRFELQEYKNLLELVQPFRSMVDNPDPAYIFRKLELRGAIQHCATAYEPCYDFHNEERDLVDLEYGKQKLAKSSAVNIAIPKIQLEADSEMLSLYHSTKAKLTGTGKEPEPERALSLISSSFLKTVSSELVDMRKGTLLELGMTPIMSTGSTTLSEMQDENSVNGSIPVSNADGSEASEITRNSELDLYLHSVEEDVLNTVNKSGRAQKSLRENETNMVLKDKSIQDFMKPPTIDLNKPLELVQRKKDRELAGDLNISLNLNDIKLPSSSSSGSPMPVRVNLKASDTIKEDDEELIPLPLPRRKKRGAKRNAILLHAAKPRSRVTKSTTYNPCSSKSLLDDEDIKVPIPCFNQPAISSTSLPTSDIPILSDQPKKDATIDVYVKIASGVTIKSVKVKLKLTSKKLEEIQRDPNRLSTLKKNIDPLVKMSLIGPDRNKVWLIQDIELCDNVKEKVSKKSPVKPLCFKNRFECLKEEEVSEKESDSDSSSDESFTLNPPKRISKSKIDDDYVPLSDDDDRDKMLMQEFEREEFYESEMSSPDEDYCYFPRKRGRRSRYITTIERGPLDSDKLILPKSETGSVKMVPINVGGKIRYFPACDMVKAEPSSNAKEDSEGETSNKENIMDNLNTWNDFSSPSGPPLCKRRFSRSGNKEISKQFSYLYPRNPRIQGYIAPILPEVVTEKKKRGRGRPKKSLTVEQHEKKFKEYFDKVTRRTRSNSTGANDDALLNSSVSEHEGDDEIDPEFIGPDSGKQQSSYIHNSPESNSNHRPNTRVVDTNRELPCKSNSYVPYKGAVSNFIEIAPKTESNAPQQTIKKEFASTVDELVEDWDDDDQVIEHETGTTNQMSNSNADWNSSLAKQEPLDSMEEMSTPPESLPDIDFHSDSESGHQITEDPILTTQLLASPSVTMTDSYSGLSEILQPSSSLNHEYILHDQDMPQINQDPILTDSFENVQTYEEAIKNKDESFEEANLANITTDDLKNALYCKIKTQDGKDLFVPFTMMPQIKSDGIEILDFEAAELKLCTSPQKIMSPIHLENSFSSVPLEIANCDTSSLPLATTEPYFSSSQISVKNSSHTSNSISNTYDDEYFQSKSLNSEPTYSNWEPLKAVDFIDLANVSTSPLKPVISSPMPIQSTSSNSLKTLVSSPMSIQRTSLYKTSVSSPIPIQSTSSSSLKTSISSPIPIQSTSSSVGHPSPKTPKSFPSSVISQLPTSQKCKFFFSPKLKTLTSSKLASGRPPSPVATKPLVKFVFKGKSWMSKNKKF